MNIHLLLFALLLVVPMTLQGGTTGKLAGQVVDDNQQPLPGSNVVIAGTSLGGATDAEGYYRILNIPPGTYTVNYSFIGYKTVVVEKVLIVSDNTTTQNVQLVESALEADAVVIVADRPIVETNLTSSKATVTNEDIENLPVQELQDIVNLQAGVVDGHFRGGRTGEVQYQINGVTVNNSFDNSSSLRIDRSLLQEVQVISGTFDAEYGQAMSGVVNAVLKSGTEKLQWNAEAFISDYVFSNSKRVVEDEFKPLSQQNYQISLSGPTGLPDTRFIFSGRRFIDDGYVTAVRRFVPTDRADFEAKVFSPTGDNEEMPLSYTHEWSGLAKISNRSFENLELSYQAIANNITSKRYSFAFRFNPDGAPIQRNVSVVHGLDITHTLTKNTFYSLSLRHNYFDYSDYVYEDFNDPRYDAAGPPIGDIVYEIGANVQGVDLTRYIQKTNARVLKASLTSQVNREHQIKFGVELQDSDITFGTPDGYIVGTGGTSIIRHENEPPDYSPASEYQPNTFAAYGQDQIEWKDLVVRAGARLEYFDARATIPSDLQNPANAISGAPESHPQGTTKKTSIAPRLGVSHPISSTAAVFFAYGHFYQMPALGQIFSNANYAVLDELQEGGISYGVLGNPDIKPERTIQYEFGYKHALTDFLGLDFSIFYKDIRDLLGVEFVSTYAAAEYARFTNVDFGNVTGFTIAFDQRRVGLFSSTLDYTWQRAQGNSSDPRETATRASAGEDPRPEQIPLSWDQRHTLNATMAIQEPDNFSLSAVFRYAGGQPYTPQLGSGFGAGLERNSGKKASSLLIDLRAEKYLKIAGLNTSLFVRTYNLLDTRFVNGFVFSDTGSPDYTLTPNASLATLANPGRYYSPRRIEVGFTLNSGL
ncbi:MAG: TonB-dependent receptor [Deferribacteres bacterium]|nr:TonB-dependent receptor [candidate division KSB1 bacterium]MCB9501456.1 TonB-dependent receptor [Deferribacteres bacterium]